MADYEVRVYYLEMLIERIIGVFPKFSQKVTIDDSFCGWCLTLDVANKGHKSDCPYREIMDVIEEFQNYKVEII